MPKTGKVPVTFDELKAAQIDRIEEKIDQLMELQAEIIEKLQNLNLGQDFSIFSSE